MVKPSIHDQSSYTPNSAQGQSNQSIIIVFQRMVFFNQTATVDVSQSEHHENAAAEPNCLHLRWIFLICCALLMLPVYLLVGVIMIPVYYLMWICIPCLGGKKDDSCCIMVCCFCVSWPIGPLIIGFVMPFYYTYEKSKKLKEWLGI